MIGDRDSKSRYHGPPSRIEMYERNIERQGVGMYFVKECTSLRPFFSSVQRHVPPGSRLLEFGYGPGVLAIYLSRCGYKVLGIDMEPDVVALARRISKSLGGAAQYQVCDMFAIDNIFGPDSFDAVFSDVTLEHYSDREIIDALQRQLNVAKLSIFAVHCSNLLPKFFTGLGGGERLLKPSQWDDLVKKAGGKVIDHFGYGFYYTRIGQLNWRVPVIAEAIFWRRLARFAAVTGFVVRRREL